MFLVVALKNMAVKMNIIVSLAGRWVVNVPLIVFFVLALKKNIVVVDSVQVLVCNSRGDGYLVVLYHMVRVFITTCHVLFVKLKGRRVRRDVSKSRASKSWAM